MGLTLSTIAESSVDPPVFEDDQEKIASNQYGAKHQTTKPRSPSCEQEESPVSLQSTLIISPEQYHMKELVPYNEKLAAIQRELHWGVCAACQAEGYDKKKCTGCGVAKYCNKLCQRKDFSRHKGICERFARFNLARSRLPEKLRELYFNKAGFVHMSYFLGDIPDCIRYVKLGPLSKVCVLVEIVAMTGDFLTPRVVVRDITNQTTEIFLLALQPFMMVNGMPLVNIHNLQLLQLMVPGNFLILKDMIWRFYDHKAARLYVEDPRQITIMDKPR